MEVNKKKCAHYFLYDVRWVMGMMILFILIICLPVFHRFVCMDYSEMD